MDDTVQVPGAERAVTVRLPDLTTAGLLQRPNTSLYTDRTDWLSLHTPDTTNPRGVPGLQVDGYFPDTSTFNTTHGWHHDSQFVLRIPDAWNGGLVVAGAPGLHRQYACDFLFSDFVLARGFAYACTDKGNNGPDFYRDGDRPGDAVGKWHERMTQLTIAAQGALRERFDHPPRRTYLAGISNGGYLVRWQLEHHPELYDATAADMYAAGFAPGSEPLWPEHQQTYWGVTQKTYRAQFDPTYDLDCPGATAGTTLSQILKPCPSDATYDAWFADRRSQPVHEALARISLTGTIGKPLLSLHGTLDSLLPISLHGDVYARMVADAQRDRLHRYYRIEGGNHIDSLVGRDPQRLRPMLPGFRAAFAALIAWVEEHQEPPASATIPRPGGNGAADPLLNSCSLRSAS